MQAPTIAIAQEMPKAIYTHSIHEWNIPVDGAVNTVFKIPKVIPLKTLLDAHSRGNNRGLGNESDMVDRELKEKQRKKRRGLRR